MPGNEPIFVEVYGSEDAGIQEMERQRYEKFAEDKEADEKEDQRAKAHLANILNPVIQAIAQEQFNLGEDADNRLILSAATLTAIETFREEFAKSQPKIIEKGMHFRNNTLLETYSAYAQVAPHWNYSYNKCALFEDGVLSCVLSYASAKDAQECSQGLYFRQERAEPFARSLMLRGTQNNFYAAVRAASVVFFLSGSCVDIYLGAVARGWLEGGGLAWGGRVIAIRAFQTYVEQKRQTCRAYATRATAEASVCNLLK